MDTVNTGVEGAGQVIRKVIVIQFSPTQTSSQWKFVSFKTKHLQIVMRKVENMLFIVPRFVL